MMKAKSTPHDRGNDAERPNAPLTTPDYGGMLFCSLCDSTVCLVQGIGNALWRCCDNLTCHAPIERVVCHVRYNGGIDNEEA